VTAPIQPVPNNQQQHSTMSSVGSTMVTAPIQPVPNTQPQHSNMSPNLIIPSLTSSTSTTTSSSTTTTWSSSPSWGVYFDTSDQQWTQHMYIKNKSIKRKYLTLREAAKANDELVRSLKLPDRPLNYPFISEYQASKGEKVSSNFHGVCGLKMGSHMNKYNAYIAVDSAVIYLGCYDNEIDAAKAYDKRAQLFPQRNLNFQKSDLSTAEALSKKPKVSLKRSRNSFTT